MVKLRVSARIIPESTYNADNQSSTPSGRRFIVIVREPEQWYVGRLANEIKVNYQRLYKNELGQIKYLKDTDDNDLDPEQLVSDVFVNEGKAARDGHDQEAVIKVIQDERHAVRQGSVVPDLTPARYKPPPGPPVPRFNDIDSALGKRGRAKGTAGTHHAHPEKRARLEEIEETQNEDEVIPSVEQSPELIHDTQELDMNEEDHQDSSEDDVDTGSPTQDRAPRKAESGPRRSLAQSGRGGAKSPQHIQPLSVDESRDRSRATKSTLEGGRTSSKRSELPLTPPTDASRNDSGSKKSPLENRAISRSAPPSKSAPPSGKFKASGRRDMYALPPESDIEDSQMDLNTANETTSRRKASVLEELDTKCSVLKDNGRPCSRVLSCKLHSMTAKRAVAGRSEPFDNLLRKSKRGLNMSSPMLKPRLVTTDVSATKAARNQEPSAPSSAFDAEAALDPMDVDQEIKKMAAVADVGGANKPTTSTTSHSDNEDTSDEDGASEEDSGPESGSSDDSHETSRDQTSKDDSGEDDSTSEAETGSTTPKQADEIVTATTKLQGAYSKPNVSTASSQSTSASSAASSPVPANTTGRIVKKRRRHAKQDSEVDSPGEQLTQSLQESASKNSTSNDVSQRFNSTHQSNGRSESRVKGVSTEEHQDSRTTASSTPKETTLKGKSTAKTKKSLRDKLKDAKTTQDSKTAERERTPEAQLADQDVPLPSIEKPKASPAARLKTPKPILPVGMTQEQYEQLMKQPARSKTPAEIRMKEYRDDYNAKQKEKKNILRGSGKQSVSTSRDSSSAIPEAAVATSLKIPQRKPRSSATPADDIDAITAKLKNDTNRLSSPTIAKKSSMKKSKTKKQSVDSIASPSAAQPPRAVQASAQARAAATRSSSERSPSATSTSPSIAPVTKSQTKPPVKNTPKSASVKPTAQPASKTPTISKLPPTPLAKAKTPATSARPVLKDLKKAMAENASKQSSPAPKTAEKKTEFMLKDDSSSESDSSDDDEAAVGKKPVIKRGEGPRPDPSIRDRSEDDSSDEEESSSDQAGDKKGAKVVKKSTGVKPVPTIRAQSSEDSSDSD